SPFIKYVLLPVFGLLSYQLQAQQIDEQSDVPASPIREEIQRYTGYEDLLQRYVSLPYDLTMNKNISDIYVDISFLLLLFLPLLLLLSNRQRPAFNLTIIATSLLMLVIAIPTGYSSQQGIALSEVGNHLSSYLDSKTWSEAPIDVLIAHIYQCFNSLYQPLDYLLSMVTGQADYITYPLLVGLFLGILQLVNIRIEHHALTTKALINVLSIFSLLWLVLAAGIPWYGLLMITLGIMFITIGFTNDNAGFFPNANIKRYLFLVIVSIWVLMSFSYRAANYRPINETSAKNLLFPAILQYAAGTATDQQVLNSVFPQFEPAIKQINQENESLILRVGTFLPFFIEKNDQRIVTDNQLGFFDILDRRFDNKVELALAMKHSGFRYLVVDLNTARIDRTPEKTLQEKFIRLINFVNNNPALRLIATDNIIRDKNGQNIYSVTGTEIVRLGTFVVFEFVTPVNNN
ncbi:MAG: hypothetical protein AAGK47_05020, partial [Bacteroidota bacterium]